MTATYSQIAITTLGSDTATVTFAGIPGTYTDLVLVCNAKGTTDNQELRLQFNSDTGSNYSHTVLYGDGSSAASARATNQTSGVVGNISSTNYIYFGANIQNYSNSTTNKTMISRSGPSFAVTAYVALWRSTSAITSIKAILSSGNFVSGSTFSLYGIKAE